jgi:hypothetical protein
MRRTWTIIGVGDVPGSFIGRLPYEFLCPTEVWQELPEFQWR